MFIMGYKSYSHSCYSSKSGGYSKTHVSGAGSKCQGRGYHYSSFYSKTASSKASGTEYIRQTVYRKGNTVHRTAFGYDDKGNSVIYKGCYTRYK